MSRALSKIGQGCDFRLGEGDPRWELAKASILLGLELGLILLDTAEIYSNGKSESLIGEVIRAQPANRPTVATKVSPQNLDKQGLLRSADQSRLRLGVEQLDILQLHWPNPAIAIEDTAEGLSTLMSSGRVAKIGVCNYSLKELKALELALSPLQIDFVQAEYNLFDRSVERDLLPYCQSSGKTFLAYSPLHQGHIAGSKRALDAIQRISLKHTTSDAEVVLAWLCSRPGVIPLPKTISTDRMRQNAAASKLHLSSEELDEINREAAWNPRSIEPQKIKVVEDGMQGRAVYRNKAEAIENKLSLTPSPQQVSQRFLAGEFLKPVRVRPSKAEDSRYEYELIEGRLRYWGWVIAFGEDKPIPALVHEL